MEYAEEIQLAGNRAAGLVNQLLAFSRKQILEPRVIDLNALLINIRKLLNPVLGEDIEFVTDLHEHPLHVLADPGQMEQVIVNLAANARDAIPGEGTLVMETRLFHMDKHNAPEGISLDPGSFAVLSVTDSGEGIPEKYLSRIFDPFFTSKELNKGTGLGLSTVHGIVRQSGGDITVDSEAGKGSTFNVYLPITEETPLGVELEKPPNGTSETEACETILLVEDETSVSGLVETVLSREGYVVHTAGNGAEALALVASLDLKPDLLLTDVIMPVMGGPELAEKLTGQLPGLKVLFASGYTDNALNRSGALENGKELIQKPFSRKFLLDKLREMLDND